MATNKRDTLIVGLRNAHALEGQALSTMGNVRSRLTHYPDFERVVAQHIEETHEQQRLVEQCLHRFGEKPSTLKEMATKLAGNMAALAHMVTSDEVLKNLFSLYAFEHFEIASYKSLIEMAEQAQEAEVGQTCRQILQQEETAAKKLHDLIGPVTRAYVDREATGATSSR